jgi:hypothetical protein
MRKDNGYATTTKRRAASMYTLPVSQCPKCVLRFGSPSERDLHLRDDHPVRQSDRPLPAALARDLTTTRAARRPSQRLPRWAVRGLLAAGLLAAVAVVSWDAAAILTVFFLAGVIGWTLRRGDAR